MNYRHAYHAGNFADCMKHALLVWLLRAMARKEKPFLVLDTHAGAGRYDLTAGEAERTGEWRGGIARLLENTPACLADYVAVVRSLGLYPGSPAIAQALLRANDRLVCCELQPDEAAALQRNFHRGRRVGAHRRDGYEALRAFLPPQERRGLVLIDPPFEATDEAETMIAALRTAHRKFPTGVFAAWYPIKHRAPVRALHETLRGTGITDIVAVEFYLREPLDAGRLNGCGLAVINPPYGFEAEAAGLLEALVRRLADEPGRGAAVIRLVDE